MTAIEEAEPKELNLPVFLPDDYDGLYSVAQALAKRFMELYAENKELRVKPEPTEFTKEVKKYMEHSVNPHWTDLAIYMTRACVIIEQQVEIALKSLEACTLANIENMKLQAKIDKLVEGQEVKMRAGS